MGIVIKQSINNSIVSSIGMVLGAVNILLLFPNIFESEQFGLTRLIMAIATLYSQFSAFGIQRIAIKFFPFFRTSDNKHNGFFPLVLSIPLIGFLLITACYVFMDDFIINHYKEKSSLFIDNYYYVIPFAFFMLYCNIFDGILQVLYRTVFSNFLTNVLLRIFWMIAIVCYYYKLLHFDLFLLFFVYAYGIILIINIVYLFSLKQLHFKINSNYFRPRILKSISLYGLFSLLSGTSSLITTSIDKIMIGFMLGLSNTGIYSVAIYFSSLILIPFQSITRIIFPIVSHEWKKKNYAKIEDLYKKSTITQLLLSGVLFLFLWLNIDNIFLFMPLEYANGKYVFLLVALAQLFNTATGINGHIIIVSKFYKFDTSITIALAVFTVITNYLFIPIWGIEGAAFATMLSVLAFNIVRTIFVYVKFKMQPFTIKTLGAIAIIFMTYLITDRFPHADNFIVDIILRCIVISIVFFPSIYFFNISEDINKYVDDLKERVFK